MSYNIKNKIGRFSNKTLSDGSWYPSIPITCQCPDINCRQICWYGNYKSGHNTKTKEGREILCNSNLGRTSGMKGRRQTPEAKEKNRLSHLGKSPEKHWNYQGGKSFIEYPKEFDEELKESIRKRDNYVCQMCGKIQEQELFEYKLRLAIHHINRNKKDCRPENLISLCVKCHTKINFDEYTNKNILRLITRINNMSTLSNEDIKICLNSGILKIHGMNEKTIRENGVDLTLSKVYAIENDNIDKNEIIDMHNLKEDRFIIKESNGEIILYPNQFMLLSTKEIIEVPNNIMGFCCIRSTIARNGILCPPTILDCGFHGALTIEIFNTTKRPILLHEGDRFLHVVFDYVSTPSTTPYCGKYQGQMIVTPPQQSII